MRKYAYNFIFTACLMFSANLYAESLSRIINPVGFGGRAYGLANNYVALSNDLSGIYWNPAALSFSLVRELNISLEGLKLESKSEFFGTGVIENIQRIKINNAGLMVAIPASQGGLTIAGSYYSPVLFDDISAFRGKYRFGLQQYFVDNRYKTTGGLNHWSGGFGLQIAQNTAFGIAGSLVSGRENAKYSFYERINNVLDTAGMREEEINGKYLGYDVRLGMMYKTELVSAGLRVTLPQIIRFNEKITGYREAFEGKLYSSYSGAAGISVTLPFLTLTTEGRFTLPYNYVFPSEDIPSSSQAGSFKIGAGAGVEFPLVVAPMLLRVGYSYDELDLHKYIVRYDDEPTFDWTDAGVVVDRNRNQITGGIGFFSSNVSFDVTYGVSFWSLITNTTLKQDYVQQRVMASFAFRY